MATLGRHKHIGRVMVVTVQGLSDQLLVVSDLAGVTVIGVGRVDESNAGLERGMDRHYRPLPVRPPLDRHRHPAESDRREGMRAEVALLHVASFRGGCRPEVPIPWETSNQKVAAGTREGRPKAKAFDRRSTLANRFRLH